MRAIIQARPWDGDRPPRKILVMRFQALGDTIITLPYLRSLKRQYPECELHFLTRYEVSHILRHLGLFDSVLILRGGRNAKLQFVLALLKLPRLFLHRYDAVLDLQNNRISRTIRKVLRPRGWSAFDVSSPLSAGERTRQTIEGLWRWKISLDTRRIESGQRSKSLELLQANGYQPGHELVVLNPAGYCASRNWPLDHYVEFAARWRKDVNPMTQFVLLLLPVHASKARYLHERMGNCCVDLTGKANQVEAFGIISHASLMLTEDSGLMHMAWTQAVPTVALFSSSRKDWSAPQGEWSLCLDSSDMACGPCNLATCLFGDNRCITRYTAEFVLKKAIALRSQAASA